MSAATEAVVALAPTCSCFKRPKIIVKPGDIRAIIPHGRRGIHIDGITYYSTRERVVVGVRTIRASDCPDHFDTKKDLPQVAPGAYLQEMGYQAALYLFSLMWPEQIGAPLACQTKNAGFALMGETILFEVRLKKAPGRKHREGRAVMMCTSAHDQRLIMEHHFKFTSASYALFRRAIRQVRRKVFPLVATP